MNFGATYAGAYDALYESKDYGEECRIIEAILSEIGGIRPFRRILDLGCGTGNHAVILAEHGYQVTGVDSSPSMLHQAQEKAKSGNWSIDFRLGDIRNLLLDEPPFDAVIMMFAVLGYQVTDEDLHASLRGVRTQLAPGGVFVFDVWYGPGVLFQKPSRRERTIKRDGDDIVRRVDSVLDENAKSCTVRYDLERLRRGKSIEAVHEQHVMRFFFSEELKQLASDSGFDCLSIGQFSNWKSPPNNSSWSVICVFRAI